MEPGSLDNVLEHIERLWASESSQALLTIAVAGRDGVVEVRRRGSESRFDFRVDIHAAEDLEGKIRRTADRHALTVSETPEAAGRHTLRCFLDESPPELARLLASFLRGVFDAGPDTPLSFTHTDA